MKKDGIPTDYLNQLVSSLEEAELKLEKAYRNNDSELFNRLKKFMLQINEKISEEVK